jgi:hypothetical protein
MTYKGQEFHDRSEAGDQNALRDALLAAKSVIYDDGFQAAPNDPVFGRRRDRVLLERADHARYVKMKFDDGSYLEINRVGEDNLIVFWGVLGVDDIGPTIRVIRNPRPPGVN